VIANGKNGPDWQKIAALLDEWRPARLIVGMPSHADGSPSALTDAVNEFVDALGRFGLPVATVDERYSSIEAEAILRSQRAGGLAGRISKARIDSGAAALIAERWLKKEQQ